MDFQEEIKRLLALIPIRDRHDRSAEWNEAVDGVLPEVLEAAAKIIERYDRLPEDFRKTLTFISE